MVVTSARVIHAREPCSQTAEVVQHSSLGTSGSPRPYRQCCRRCTLVNQARISDKTQDPSTNKCAPDAVELHLLDELLAAHRLAHLRQFRV